MALNDYVLQTEQYRLYQRRQSRNMLYMPYYYAVLRPYRIPILPYPVMLVTYMFLHYVLYLVTHMLVLS